MRFPGAFARDERGNSLHAVSVAAGAIALASLAGSHFLERSVQTGWLLPSSGGRGVNSPEFERVMATIPRPTGASPGESLRQVTVDYTPTGSIPANLSQPIILDPCTGIRK